MTRMLLTTVTSLCLAGTASASIVVDGTAEAEFGSPIVTQTVPTQFGDNDDADVSAANGSELDAAFGVIQNGSLFLTLSGNLQSNFNKFELFVDSTAGGQNQLRNDNPDVDFNGLNRMGAGTEEGEGPGLKFDAGFAPDFYLTLGGGNDPVEWFANGAQLLTDGGGVGEFLGGSGPGNTTITSDPGGSFAGINIAINNSNTAGVDGANVNTPGDVTTGIEIEIPLALLGNPSGPVDVTAFINGSGHDFVSNQVLAGLPEGFGNLGEPRNVDFSQIDGDQFFTVVPEPGSLALLGLGGLALLRRRR